MKKNYWSQLVEFITQRAGKRFNSSAPAGIQKANALNLAAATGRPAMDPDENDRVLAQMSAGDQVYRTLMNYAYVHVENNLAVAFDAAKSVEEQRDFKNRAAGVTAFIADVETTRARLREEILLKQKLTAAKK